MEKTFKNRPNFLGSEVGLVLKTITVPANASSVIENGRKIVKAGTYFSSPYSGLLFQDVDITDGAREGSLMYGGYYIDAKLPSSVSAYASTLAGHGLFAIVEGSTTRPDFGDGQLTRLTKPTVTVTSAAISWTSVTGAIGYNVFNGEMGLLTVASTTGYTATAVGTYYIQAKADNVNKRSSEVAVATVTTLS